MRAGRALLAGLSWPVPVASIGGIVSTYGQFDNRTDGKPGAIHFHEGVDVLVGKGTEVRAIEAGTVVGLDTDQGYSNHISIATTADSGWNFIHLTPTAALAQAYQQAKQLGKSITVGANDLIGNVAESPSPNLPTHLHIDAAGSPEPNDPAWLRPVDDPLARLTPLGDTTPPTMGDVHFMRGEDDLNPNATALTDGSNTTPPSKYLVLQNEIPRTDHGYFLEADYSGAKIVGHLAPAKTSPTDTSPNGTPVGGSSNIEVIANASDKITANDPQPVGIRSIEFSAAGQLVGRTIPTVRPFNFAGQFVFDPNEPFGTQTYDALRMSDLTRVAYENDYTSPSNDDPSATISYFHILTNTDGANSVVDFADRARYWRSKVTQGAAWNDINSTEAVNNAKGAFPDDYYTFTVTARDAAGNAKSTTQKVLLDNWLQSVTYQTILDPLQPPGFHRVRVDGSQFTANSTVNVYLMTSNIADGQTITDHGTLLGSADTDADGNIVQKDFAFPEPPGGFFLLADYAGGDNIYEPRLDGNSPSTIGQGQSPVRGADGGAGGSFAPLPASPQGGPATDGDPAPPAPSAARQPAPRADDPAPDHGTPADDTTATGSVPTVAWPRADHARPSADLPDPGDPLTDIVP